MFKFRMICPDCGAAVITASPQVLIWESCPRCRTHAWDMHDLLMADKVEQDSKRVSFGPTKVLDIEI